MAEVRVRWLEGLKFLATDAEKHSILIDPPVESGGEGLAFKPSQLLLIALASCTGIDIVNILHKGRQGLTGLEIIVDGDQSADPPWPYERFHVQYIVRGKGLSEAAVARAVELSETKYCSVGATLSGSARITSSFRIEEAE